MKLFSFKIMKNLQFIETNYGAKILNQLCNYG